jgi:hypothetical protein
MTMWICQTLADQASVALVGEFLLKPSDEIEETTVHLPAGVLTRSDLVTSSLS